MNEQNLQVAKKMLEVNRKILKSMHNTFGIDFENELTIKEIKLPKTLKRIIQENNITDETTNYLLIQRKNWSNEVTKEFNVILFNAEGRFKIDGFYTDYQSGLDNYYRKSDFEDDRKRENLKAFIVIVPKQLNNVYSKLNEYGRYSYHKNKTEEMEQAYKNDKQGIYRVKYNKDNIRTCYYSNTNIHSVYSFTNVRIDNFNFNYACIEYDKWQFKNQEKQEHDLIDKSGYNVHAKRYDLSEKVRLIKENKNKKAIIQTDFLSLNCELLQEFNRLRNILAGKLLTTDMFTDEFSEILDKLRDLKWITRDYKNHEKKLNDIKSGDEKLSYWNKYNTVDEIKKSINNMINKLHEIEIGE